MAALKRWNATTGTWEATKMKRWNETTGTWENAQLKRWNATTGTWEQLNSIRGGFGYDGSVTADPTAQGFRDSRNLSDPIEGITPAFRNGFSCCRANDNAIRMGRGLSTAMISDMFTKGFSLNVAAIPFTNGVYTMLNLNSVDSPSPDDEWLVLYVERDGSNVNVRVSDGTSGQASQYSYTFDDAFHAIEVRVPPSSGNWSNADLYVDGTQVASNLNWVTGVSGSPAQPSQIGIQSSSSAYRECYFAYVLVEVNTP